MRRFPGCFLVAILLAGTFAQAPSVAGPRKVRVFAAASLAEAFGELGRLADRARPGEKVELNLAGSQQLVAQLGQADAGFVYRSDVESAVRRYVTVFEIPDSANVLAAYSIAVLAAAPHPDAARAFVERVRSEAGQRILARHGFLPAVSGTP